MSLLYIAGCLSGHLREFDRFSVDLPDHYRCVRALKAGRNIIASYWTVSNRYVELSHDVRVQHIYM